MKRADMKKDPNAKSGTTKSPPSVGRGQGRGAHYEPYLKTHNVPSRGLSTRVKSPLNGRVQHTLSQLETDWLDAFHGISGLTDVREQVPLGQEETMLLADQLGIAHPVNPETKQPNVLTTDFVVTLVEGMREYEIAFAVKPSADLGSARTLEKLELERLFWTARKIPWRILTEREVPRALVKNLRWVQPHLDLVNSPGYGPEQINRIRSGMEPLINEGADSLVAITAGCDDRLGLQPGSALCVARHLIGTGAWPVDMMVEINPREPLRLQSSKNKYELAA
jgi:hypothetical protein